MLKNPKGSPLSVFFGIVRFFPENENFCFLQFFHVLRQNGCWKTSKGPPFSFSALWDFSAPGPIFWVCNFFEKFFKKLRFSSTVKEYLTLGSLFAIFEPWIWRRLNQYSCSCNLKQLHNGHLVNLKLVRELFDDLGARDFYATVTLCR